MGFHFLVTFDIFDGAIQTDATHERENAKGFLTSSGERTFVSTDTTEWSVAHDRTDLKTCVRPTVASRSRW